MNLEKVAFAFFIVLALTLNFGFFVGEPKLSTRSQNPVPEVGSIS